MSLLQVPLRTQLSRLPKNKTYRSLALVSITICLFCASRFAFYYNLDCNKEHTSIRDIEQKTGKGPSASVVGKVHVLFRDSNPTYERALVLHKAHAERNGHPMFVCREKILSGLWTKPAFILSVILAELAKPEKERLQWLLWNNADVVVMNPQISLNTFIPPSPEFDYVNLLKTHDRHGLNNGVFLIKVNDWSVKLLTAVVSFHHFRPLVELKYSEQSALEEMLKDTSLRRSVVRIPQCWFNAYPPSARENAILRANEFRAGGLQIHFAGNRDGKRDARMDAWMDIAKQQSSEWVLSSEQSGLVEEISVFWQKRTADRLCKRDCTTYFGDYCRNRSC